ncbi:uncharacterized protein LOC144445875 [Glandiceps talaboti]
MAEQFTPTHIRKVFEKLDSDQDGYISCPEFKSALQQNGYRDDQMEEIMKNADLDGDGKLDFNEFSIFWVNALQSTQNPKQKTKTQSATSGKIKLPTVKQMRKEFDCFDIDGKGYITIDDVKKKLEYSKGSWTKEEVYKFMTDADEDCDGRITFAEFIVAKTRQILEKVNV